MLARVVPTRHGFADLARYLIKGPTGTPHPDRVQWLVAQNLPDSDPDLAAKIMTATAKLSPRTKKPTYHAMIAWHPDEAPTPEAMQAIAVQTLALLGLDEHQALIVGHGDTDHPHLHLMVNRVHPGTGKAWRTAHDYRRLDEAMQRLALTYEFEHVPGHAFSPDDTDDLPTQPTAKAHHAAKRGAKTTRPQWSKAASRHLGADLADDLDQAQSWDDLDAAINRQGLTLAAKGQGLIVGDETSYSKFSALRLGTNAEQLERRFGERFLTYRKRRPMFTVDAVDIAKAVVAMGLAGRDSVTRAVQDVTAARQRALATKALNTQVAMAVKQAFSTTGLARPARDRIRNKPAPRATQRTSGRQRPKNGPSWPTVVLRE